MSWRAIPWLIAALLPTLALAGINYHVKHEHWPDDYDHLFRKYTKHYFGAHFDWHWFKAQGIAESGLDPDAKSPAGAIGIMQILPSTYREIASKNPFMAGIREPRWNIAAGIFYDRQLYRKWQKKRAIRTGERLKFAFGSYNAGYGTLLRAHKRAEKKVEQVKRWEDIAPHLPRETQGYVARIERLMTAVD